MKKILITSISILLLAGCSFGNGKKEVQLNQENNLADKKEEKKKDSNIAPINKNLFSLEGFPIRVNPENYNNKKIIKEDLSDIFYDEQEENQSIEKEISVGNFKFKIINDDEKINSSLSIYKNGSSIISEYNKDKRYVGISKIILNNVDYYVFELFTFGAHCCHSYKTIIHKDNALAIGEEIKLENSTLGIENDSFFEKDGQLYFLVGDSSLAYYKSGYAGSIFFPVFYKINQKTADFEMVNNEFKEYYKKLAVEIEKRIEDIKKEIKLSPSIDLDDSYLTQERFWPLALRLIFDLQGGAVYPDFAKKRFIDDSKIFFNNGIIDGDSAETVANYLEKHISGLQ